MRRAALLLTVLLAGCVYYNGMYNARRLAGMAEKAEREGRTLDASSYWGQVAVKAESVIVRHPDSKWVDNALVLRGRALVQTDQCPAAVDPLQEAITRVRDVRLREQAMLALARCRSGDGDLSGADLLLNQVVGSRDAARQADARTLLADNLVNEGRYAEALKLLEGLQGLQVGRTRMLAAAGAGPTDLAMRLADSALSAGDTTRAEWSAFVDMLATRDPGAASRMVDTLAERIALRAPERSAWFLADAHRLLPYDSAAARARLEQAAQVGGERAAAWNARFELATAKLRSADTLGALLATIPDLATLAEGDGAAADSAARLARLLRELAPADSVLPGTPQGDLRLFFAAELARDSLGTPAVAASLFRRVADQWADGPYAAKALLALMPLDSAGADTVRSILLDRYAGSPYVAFLQGDSATSYLALEDSMRAYAQAHAPDGKPAGRAAPEPGAVRGRRPAPSPEAPTSGRRTPDDSP